MRTETMTALDGQADGYTRQYARDGIDTAEKFANMAATFAPQVGEIALQRRADQDLRDPRPSSVPGPDIWNH